MPPVAAKQLRDYQRTLLPEEKPCFSRKRSVWLPQRDHEGRDRLLTEWWLQAHLDKPPARPGKKPQAMQLAARWTNDQRYRLAVVDVDAHTDWQRQTLLDRVREVRGRLVVPTLLVRSSSSGGVHVYLFLRRGIRADRLRERLENLLSGIEGIDIFPPQKKSQVLRMPFGQGSCVLNDDLEPIYGRFLQTRGGQRLHREVARDIEHAVAFAGENRYPLDALGSGRWKATDYVGPGHPQREETVVAVAPDATSDTKKRKRSTPKKPTLSRDEYFHLLSISDDGIPAHGLRWRVHNARVFFFRVHSDDDAVALQKYKRWLITNAHVSEDLESGAITKDGMLQDAKQYAQKLGRQMDRRELFQCSGCKACRRLRKLGRVGEDHTLDVYNREPIERLSSDPVPQKYRRKRDSGIVLESALGQILSGEERSWIGCRLARVRAALRRYRDLQGRRGRTGDLVTISGEFWRRVAGRHEAREWPVYCIGGAWSRRRIDGARILRASAIQADLIEPVQRAEWGARAAIYQVLV